MSLFSATQIDQINKTAEKVVKQMAPVQNENVSKVNSELRDMELQVEEYFSDSNAILIETPEQLEEYVDTAIASGLVVGIDTETTGLDRVKDYIVGASLYCEGQPECYIPIMHKNYLFDQRVKNQLEYEDVSRCFQKFVDAGTKMIFANADFDLAMIYKDLHVDMNDICYFDVILAWRCLKENELHNDLKSLYNKYVLKGKGNPMKFRDFFTPKLFPYCKPKIAKLYAANDAKITVELYMFELQYLTIGNPKCKKAHLEKIAKLVWDVEFPLIKVVQNMHRRGMYLDKTTADILKVRYRKKLEKQQAELAMMVDELIADCDPAVASKRPFATGKDLNVNSVTHMKYLVYSMIGIPAIGGKMGTGKDVLTDLNLPITNKILEIRSTLVLINTFVEKLPKSTTSDSRIHAQFKQMGAACVTGDTYVPTDKGFRKIADICDPVIKESGRMEELTDVNVFNKDQQLEQASHAIRYDDVDTIKITTEFGLSIEGTPNHPIMVSKYTASDKSTILHQDNYKLLYTIWDNRYFKELKDIQIGDIIEVPCNYSYTTEYQPSKLDTLPSRFNPQLKMPEIIDEPFAEFLGMYHADGSHCFREGTFTVALSNDDPDVYTRFDELALQLFNVKTCRYAKQAANHEVETYINAKGLMNLNNILTTGKQNKRIPEIIKSSPTSVIDSYIRGMTLDSSVYYDNQVQGERVNFSISIINLDDCRFIQQYLMSKGIASYIGVNKPTRPEYTTGYVLSFNSDNYMLFRDTIGFIESKKNLYSDECKKNKCCYRRVGDSFLVKVKQIEHLRSTVYDLHVPESHSFISNGFISHNTGRLSCAEPNLQNIPSHSSDIRRTFRATPAIYEEVHCESQDDNIEVELNELDKVYTKDNGKQEVRNLKVNENIQMLFNGVVTYLTLQSIDELDHRMYRLILQKV